MYYDSFDNNILNVNTYKCKGIQYSFLCSIGHFKHSEGTCKENLPAGYISVDKSNPDETFTKSPNKCKEDETEIDCLEVNFKGK